MKVILIGLMALLLGCGWGVEPADPVRPNVLLIISDDQAWGDYSFMGHPQIRTPNLDRLAAESLTFQRGYTPTSVCRPSLASIITGLYPHRHGVTSNDPELPDPGARAMRERANPRYAPYYEALIENFQRHPNLVRDLVSRGYVALQTGKWWEGNPVKTAGFTRGMTRGEGRSARHGDDGLAIGRAGLEPVYRFIDQAEGRPFLVWYAPSLPHTPHTPPESLLRRYLRLAPTEPVARYWASVEWLDRTCGRLLDYLDRKGLRENTIIVYTTDNGWIQDPDRANRFASHSKNTPYEDGVRTPIMIRWPEHIEPRVDSEHLASNLDLWPTLAGLLELPVPPDLPGINLADPAAVARRQRIFGEQYGHRVADVNEPTRSLKHRWIIEGWRKLIVPREGSEDLQGVELYDLREDPGEASDLARESPEEVRRLLLELDAWWTPVAPVTTGAATPNGPG